MQAGDLDAELAHEGHVVLDHDHGLVAVDLLEQLGGLLGLGVGHAGDRLVDQQQLRFLREQHADLEPLLLAVRQAAGDARAHVLEPDVSRMLVDARLLRRRLSAPDQGARARARRPSARAARLSSTVCISNTVGFWNLRPMPSSAISVSSSLVRS